MRCCSRPQSLNQTQLCVLSKVSVEVRTSLGTVPELRLQRLDGVPVCHRFACDRLALKRVVAEWLKSERLLDGDHRAFVAFDVERKRSVLAVARRKATRY